MDLRLGTRGSRLARTQSGTVAAALRARGHSVELVVISTRGDEITDRPFAAIGAPGVFVREIESALLQGRIDLAVHSYKDLPTDSPDELVVAAVPERVDPADVLLVDAGAWFPDGHSLPLAQGSVVGTSSARRTALLREIRPDLRIEGIRGNVPTRMEKCRDEPFSAIVLASAGLLRLQAQGVHILDGQRVHPLPCSIFVPAPSQGALALQVLSGSPAEAAVGQLEHGPSRTAVEAERAVLAALEGGCDAAVGAWCLELSDGWRLHAAFGTDEGVRRAQATSVHAADCVGPVVRELLG